MADCMAFPETFDEFAEWFGFVDSKEYYTNGAKLIPVFRVKQWLENENNRHKAEIKRLQERNVILKGAVDTQKAEIERLNCNLDMANDCISEQRAEAIKELLDKIEKQAIPNEDDMYWVELDDIYNLVKEMAGEIE